MLVRKRERESDCRPQTSSLCMQLTHRPRFLQLIFDWDEEAKSMLWPRRWHANQGRHRCWASYRSPTTNSDSCQTLPIAPRLSSINGWRWCGAIALAGWTSKMLREDGYIRRFGTFLPKHTLTNTCKPNRCVPFFGITCFVNWTQSLFLSLSLEIDRSMSDTAFLNSTSSFIIILQYIFTLDENLLYIFSHVATQIAHRHSLYLYLTLSLTLFLSISANGRRVSFSTLRLGATMLPSVYSSALYWLVAAAVSPSTSTSRFSLFVCQVFRIVCAHTAHIIRANRKCHCEPKCQNAIFSVRGRLERKRMREWQTWKEIHWLAGCQRKRQHLLLLWLGLFAVSILFCRHFMQQRILQFSTHTHSCRRAQHTLTDTRRLSRILIAIDHFSCVDFATAHHSGQERRHWRPANAQKKN